MKALQTQNENETKFFSTNQFSKKWKQNHCDLYNAIPLYMELRHIFEFSYYSFGLAIKNERYWGCFEGIDKEF